MEFTSFNYKSYLLNIGRFQKLRFGTAGSPAGLVKGLPPLLPFKKMFFQSSLINIKNAFIEKYTLKKYKNMT
jgi:hypothetical protein